MRYFPSTESDVQEMLEAIGVPSTDELFQDIPEAARVIARLNLPDPLSELELLRAVEDLGKRNLGAGNRRSFLGAGAYDRYVPAAIDLLLSRGEFYTAYTPYQPEISQGTLQAVFEYQSMVCGLLEMDISNASMYDGASALGEAVWMARRVSRKHKVVLAGAIHPDYLRVVTTYCEPFVHDLVTVGAGAHTGQVDLEALRHAIDDDTAALVVQSPSFLGTVEDLEAVAGFARANHLLLIVAFTDAVAYGLLKPPGRFGADIAVGEGQALGIPLSFGGPYLGIFTAQGQYVRSMPGRLVGRTTDARGDEGYVLTLSTREQHIRRERATSNICTNQGLCALASAIYLALMGPQGLNRVATASHLLAERLKARLARVGRVTLPLSGPTFSEFVVELPGDAEAVVKKGLAAGLVAGHPLIGYADGWSNRLLVSVTEKHTLDDLEALAAFLERAA
jgi:glycine dehydrogenase subunit 1